DVGADVLLDRVEVGPGIDAGVVVAVRIKRVVQVHDAVRGGARLADPADYLARAHPPPVGHARRDPLEMTVEMVPAAVVDDRDLVARVVRPSDQRQPTIRRGHDRGSLGGPDVVSDVIAREEVLVRIGVVAGPEARIAGVSVVSVVVRAAHRVDGHDRIAVYGGGNRADRLAFGHACREGERRDDDEWRSTGRHGTDRRYAWSPAPTRGPIEQPKSAGSAGARIGLKPVAEMPRHRFGAREPS